MGLVTCENIGVDLTEWLQDATELQRQELCEEMSCTQKCETALTTASAPTEDDHGKLNTAGGTITLDASLPEGWRMDIIGAATVTTSGGATIRSVDGLVDVLADGGASVVKISATEFWLAGALE